MSAPDEVITPPANPGANSQVVWFDTKNHDFGSGRPGCLDRSGFLGSIRFDQAVTLSIKKGPFGVADADLVVANNDGAADVMPANETHEVKAYFGGGRTQIVLTTVTACTVWHVDGRLTSRPVL